ncbi:hypothetical protein [Paraburkholderia silvatlantica]|uniref:Uncharacterized protein n=1 Tax=Paraburkholderia silvatlantica TaxID=321895 RepID=A0ABR6FRK5_9BURK|nr:hypothetical protein [Paraburkholderia silvatlantica]MBB2930026.1 hypothetical protein [Paraburkholderia silvatlantica]PVY29711.1 hypothetical protein C7411_114149 [Paraburkholderia silvatlantica]PXW31553.1 hypothetical protein C7413_12597 [Paraburkholderia silvatlantica]
MRLNIQQVRRSVIGYRSACAAMLVPAALLVLSPGARAQAVDDAPAAPGAVASVANAAPDVVPATPAALVPATFTVSAPAGDAPSSAADPASTMAAGAQAPADPVAFGNEGVFAGIGSLDDQTLSRQRGGAVGMVMVAATPQLMRGNNVTLWDEIAPPAPLPIPVDATQNAQGNLASYTRK